MKLRPAFTLFELILAIALSATLLALVGTAVNLYLLRMDTGQMRVEEAQLARSILSTIAADIRAATVYQTQDISTVQQLAAASAEFDPDSIEAAGPFSGTMLQNTGGNQGTAGTTGSGGDGGSPLGSTSLQSNVQTAATLPPGVNGLANDLQVDVLRLPRLDELFPPVPQGATPVSMAATTNVPRPSDAKTVRYFVRQGAAIDASAPESAAITATNQDGAGGLVRQAVDRAIRDLAEQSANSQLLNSGQVLLAPEVTQIQFVYFDGTTVYDVWDMQERGGMPTAIEVRIWIAPDPIEAEASPIPLEPRMHSQTVAIPLAGTAPAAASDQSQSEQSTTGSESSQSPTGSGAGIGTQSPNQ
jgi:hypothetical protein